MIRLFIVIFLIIPDYCFSENLYEDDLVGSWGPSGAFPREESVDYYRLIVDEDLSARYLGINGGNGDELNLSCDYKPSGSQNTVFVFYCYYKEMHLITLSLGGWSLGEGGERLMGFEYWLGDPEPGKIYTGLPVSLSR